MAKNNNMICKLMADNARLTKEVEALGILASRNHEEIMAEAKNVVPKIYGAMLYVLKKHYRFNQQKLMNVLNESYQVWEESLEHKENLLDWIEKETGIRLTPFEE